MYKPALGWRKRKIAMMHITKTWFEDGKMITEIIPAETVYKREWVNATQWRGLTDEEIGDFKGGYQSGRIGSFVELTQAIEAKLREKNLL